MFAPLYLKFGIAHEHECLDKIERRFARHHNGNVCADALEVSIVKPIPSAPGYFVDEANNIIGRKGKPLRPRCIKGYFYCTVSIDSMPKMRGVHALICEAFHGACPPSCEAGHLDGNRANNVPENLRWITKAENGRHRREVHFTSLPGERNPSSKLTRLTARIICHIARQEYALRPSAEQLAPIFNVSAETIRKCWNRKTFKKETANIQIVNFAPNSTFTFLELHRLAECEKHEISALAHEFKVSPRWIQKLRKRHNSKREPICLT